MTYEVLYEEYCKSTDNPYGYTQFKAIIQKYEKEHDYKYHNTYSPAHEKQFDFAGDPLWVVNTDTGELLVQYCSGCTSIRCNVSAGKCEGVNNDLHECYLSLLKGLNKDFKKKEVKNDDLPF